MDNSVDVQRWIKTGSILGWLAIACVVIAGLEISSYIFLKTYASSRVPYLVYWPPALPTRDEYENYLKRRHPILGWPGDEGSGTPHARPVPAYAESAEECITAYGDSYVYGNEVGAAEAWSNYLSERLGCRVGNYGVSAYGTGQALLRFRINESDTASVTYLGIFPANFKRTVNQYRHFISTGTVLGFKPRYYLDRGMLELAPLPTIKYEKLDFFFESPERFLQHETFLPGSALGPIHIKFPYSVRVMRIMLKEEVYNWVAGRPDWSTFIHQGHQSNALEVTAAIVSEFMRLCRDRDKKCFVVLFPARNEYDYFRQAGLRAVQPLLDELDHRGIPFLDLTRSFYKTLGGAPICSVLTQPKKCTGHFNAEGNRIVSDHLYEYLTSRGYL